MEAEQFMRIHALKAMTGAVAATIIDLTPEAVQQATEIGERGLARTRDVRMERLPDDRDGPIFDVTYIDSSRSLTLREHLREVAGEWKVTRLERTPAR